MTTDEKIVEIAGAVRLLAFHVDQIYRGPDEEVHAELMEVRDAMQKVQKACSVTATPHTYAIGPQTARGVPEPGDLIANGDCPICGSTITVEHGDDAEEIVFLAHSNQQGRDLAEQCLGLLREWRSTPFFETRQEWARWVENFGARVDAVIE